MKVYILIGWNSEYDYEEMEGLSTNKEDLEPFEWECTYIKEFDLPEDGSSHLKLVGSYFELVDKDGNIVNDGVKLIH